MKISLLLIILGILISFQSLGQTAPDKYWVQFTDKTNTPYSLSNPSDFLSTRAIQRRQAQGIPYSENDLPVDPAYVAAIENLGVQVLTRSKWFNAVSIYTTDPNALIQIQALSFVQATQKVARMKSYKDDGVNLYREFDFNQTSAPLSLYDYGAGTNQIEMLNGQVLHDNGYTGQGKVIAVVDAGFLNVDILPIFQHLWDNKQILGVRDFVTGDSTVFEDFQHGMNVLSVMGGYLPGQLIGTAPGASYWLLRSEDVGSEYVIEEDNWVVAAEFADSVGADIINSSLGYTIFDISAQNHSYADMDGNTARATIGADIAASKGILVVNSAGNSGNSAWHYIGAPADGDSVLSIGAVDEFGDYAPFSSTGPTSDGRIKPNVVAQGALAAIQNPNGNISFGNGTSFSSPIIAGMAACLWQAHPGMTNMQLLEAIQQSGSQSMNPDSLLGYGIPNFAQASVILSRVEILQQGSFAVSPNPFADFLNLEMYLLDSQDVSIQLFDLMGRKYYEQSGVLRFPGYSKVEISGLGNIQTGLYILKISTRKKSYSLKVIKG
ncbi:MAG: S8 family serine peptidase [Bacteroidales bacterium]|nr:S8 family serine peptidase [Bacteroidales bacterium]MCF8457895.1 S8 family serine peptidase [Bacteroidales bacterium]